MFRIYFISDRSLAPAARAEEIVADAIAAGVEMVQIREKDLPAKERLRLAKAAVEAARGRDVEVYVNSRADVAKAAGAHGVHLPARGVSARDVRRAAGRRMRIGVSTHSVAEARRAEEEGADFIVFGPIFETASKRSYGPPLGLRTLHEALAAVAVPVYALGGIDPGNAGSVLALPVSGIAVVSAIAAARDRREVVEAFRAAGRRVRGGVG